MFSLDHYAAFWGRFEAKPLNPDVPELAGFYATISKSLDIFKTTVNNGSNLAFHFETFLLLEILKTQREVTLKLNLKHLSY